MALSSRVDVYVLAKSPRRCYVTIRIYNFDESCLLVYGKTLDTKHVLGSLRVECTALNDSFELDDDDEITTIYMSINLRGISGLLQHLITEVSP